MHDCVVDLARIAATMSWPFNLDGDSEANPHLDAIKNRSRVTAAPSPVVLINSRSMHPRYGRVRILEMCDMMLSSPSVIENQNAMTEQMRVQASVEADDTATMVPDSCNEFAVMHLYLYTKPRADLRY